MKKIMMKAVVSGLILSIGISAAGITAAADFVDTDDGIMYKDDSGKYVKSDFLTVGGKTYYFNKEGIMQTGLKKIKKTYYYFDKDGVMATSTVKVGKYIYKFGKDGKLKEKAQGWVKLDGERYYCKSGKICTGLVTIENDDGTKVQYYFDKDGKMVKGTNVEAGLVTYYINANGIVEKVADHSKALYVELNQLREKKKKNETELAKYEKEMESPKAEMEYYKDLYDEANRALNNLLNGSATESQIRSAKSTIERYKSKYDYYHDRYLKIKQKADLCKNNISDANTRIKEIEKKLKAAGYKIP